MEPFNLTVDEKVDTSDPVSEHALQLFKRDARKSCLQGTYYVTDVQYQEGVPEGIPQVPNPSPQRTVIIDLIDPDGRSVSLPQVRKL